MNIFDEYKITQEKFEIVEKKILGHMYRVRNNINDAIKFLDEKDCGKFLEITTVSVLIYADTMSRFLNLFDNFDNEVVKNNVQQFREWVDKFVLNDCNEIYKKNKNDINCDSLLVWKLRNKLVHFYGLPNLKNEKIMIVTGNWHNEKGKKLKKEFLNKGKKLRIVDIISLRDAILYAVVPMLDYFKEILEKEPWRYVGGIMNIVKVSGKECSVKTNYATGEKIE
ncbi:hypothetical protein KJ854_04560 [Patescibacteria group bacterium]|nr:hypothetical protein [Patescibacteria group bacterium]MBU4142151.1 hypothetical protein [Patescibacteria group bacterium]